MKPPSFDYYRPATLSEAIAVLVQHEGSAKVLAGGQSLVPMLNFRLLAPSALIDIARIPDLNFIKQDSTGALRVGSLTRHCQLLGSELVRSRHPILTEAMSHVAHLAIRNRGTIGGSLCHADPAAELPMMAMLLDATMRIVGPTGMREVEARDFFVGALTTAISDCEVMTEIVFPACSGGWGFREFAQRSGDFALAAVGVILTLENGLAARVKIGVMGVGESPMRCPSAESVLEGRVVDSEAISEACIAVQASVCPEDDLHASTSYRLHLIAGLTNLAIRDAWRRANKDNLDDTPN